MAAGPGKSIEIATVMSNGAAMDGLSLGVIAPSVDGARCESDRMSHHACGVPA